MMTSNIGKSKKLDYIFLVPISVDSTDTQFTKFLLIVNSKYFWVGSAPYLLTKLTELMIEMNMNTFRIDRQSAAIFKYIVGKRPGVYSNDTGWATGKSYITVINLHKVVKLDKKSNRFFQIRFQVFHRLHPDFLKWMTNFLVNIPCDLRKEMESWVKLHVFGRRTWGGFKTLLNRGTGLKKMINSNFFLEFGWIFEDDRFWKPH